MKMKYSVIYLDTCLPDYFNGYSGVVLSVPLSAKPRNGQVKRELVNELHAGILVDGTGKALPSEAYRDMAESIEEMFADVDLRKSWSTMSDDLSESYAYFGIKEEEETADA